MLTEKVLLPSQGVIYNLPEPCPYIEVRAFNTRELKDFLVKGKNDGIDTLLNACMVNSPVKAEDLYFADTLVLLLKVRAMVFGHTLNAVDICPFCNAGNEHEWNISELQVNYLSIDKYPFEVTLPDCKEVITLSLPSPASYKRAEDLIKSRISKHNLKRVDIEEDFRIASCIHSDARTDLVLMVDWYRKLSLKDTMYIDFVKTQISDFGVNMIKSVNCADCGKTFTPLFVSQNTNFFRIQFDRPDWFKTEKGTLETGIDTAVLPE